MATRKTQRHRRRAGRKTARKYNGGGRKSGKVAHFAKAVMKHEDTYPAPPEGSPYFNSISGFTTLDERASLRLAREKLPEHYKELQNIDKELLAASNDFFTFADIYKEKPVTPGFLSTGTLEPKVLHEMAQRSMAYRKHHEDEYQKYITSFNDLVETRNVNLRNQIIMKKIEGVNEGRLNAEGEWSSSSSSSHKKSKKNSPHTFTSLKAMIHAKPAEKLPLGKNLSATTNAIIIAAKTAHNIKKELEALRKK